MRPRAKYACRGVLIISVRSESIISDAATISAEHSDFRRQWHHIVIPSAVALAAYGLFAYRSPDVLWFAIPGLCFILAFCALPIWTNILSDGESVWYAI